jgi:hypothetical protein
MESIPKTPEVRREWRTILKEQGRTMTWLAQQTGKSYPQIANWATGRAKAPEEWLDKVGELLGEPVR